MAGEAPMSTPTARAALTPAERAERDAIIEQAVAHICTPDTTKELVRWALGCALDSWQAEIESRAVNAQAIEAACAERAAEALEAAARECDERAVLNDAVEWQPEHGLARDPHTGMRTSATDHRAIEARECAAAIRALSAIPTAPPTEPPKEVMPHATRTEHDERSSHSRHHAVTGAGASDQHAEPAPDAASGAAAMREAAARLCEHHQHVYIEGVSCCGSECHRFIAKQIRGLLVRDVLGPAAAHAEPHAGAELPTRRFALPDVAAWDAEYPRVPDDRLRVWIDETHRTEHGRSDIEHLMHDLRDCRALLRERMHGGEAK